MNMDPQEMLHLGLLLERCPEVEKVAFAERFLYQLALEGRFIARRDDLGERQRKQLQGCAELVVRVLDQVRDFKLGPGHGRPAGTFLEVLSDYGAAYDLTREVHQSVTQAARELKPAGLVN